MSGQAKRSRLAHLHDLRRRAGNLIARACPGFLLINDDAFDTAKVRAYCEAALARGGSESRTAARVLAMLAGQCEWAPSMHPYTCSRGCVPDVEVPAPLWRRAAEAAYYDRECHSWAARLADELPVFHPSASMYRPTRVVPRHAVIDNFDGATGQPRVIDGTELDARINARWFGIYQGDRSPRWRRGLVMHWHRVERRKYTLTRRTP